MSVFCFFVYTLLDIQNERWGKWMMNGTELRRVRKGLGMKAIDLAKMSGVPASMISLIETGRVKQPSEQILSKLKQAIPGFGEDVCTENSLLADLLLPGDKARTDEFVSRKIASLSYQLGGAKLLFDYEPNGANHLYRITLLHNGYFLPNNEKLRLLLSNTFDSNILIASHLG